MKKRLNLAALVLAAGLAVAVPAVPACAETAGQTAGQSADNGRPDTPSVAPRPPDGYGPGGYDWGPGMMYGYGGYGMGPGMLFGGVLWMIVAWGIPLLLLFLLVRYVAGRIGDGHAHKQPPTGRTALDILKESYARGEIERDEYLRKRDDLLEK